MKLTPTQAAALAFIASEPGQSTNGYRLKAANCGNTGTLAQLSTKGLVRPYGIGHSAFPAIAMFRLTNAGRDALSI